MSWEPKRGEICLFQSVIGKKDAVPVKVMSEIFTYDGKRVVVASAPPIRGKQGLYAVSSLKPTNE